MENRPILMCCRRTPQNPELGLAGAQPGACAKCGKAIWFSQDSFERTRALNDGAEPILWCFDHVGEVMQRAESLVFMPPTADQLSEWRWLPYTEILARIIEGN